MPFTRTFTDFAPPARYDAQPFTSVAIREAATVNGSYTTIQTISLSPLDATPASPISRNFTTTAATLVDGWYILRWIDGASSTFDSDPIQYLTSAEGPAPENPENLITREEFKLAEGIASTDYDDSIDQTIGQVSAAIRRLTDRDFGIAASNETRTYQYNGGGILDIDDCSVVTAVTLDGRGLAEETDYRPQRDNDGPYFYLDLYIAPRNPTSPEMGFTRGEDTPYAGPRYAHGTALVAVTGEFGWTPVPEDVKLAAIEMIRSAANLPSTDLQSESIAEYSYSNVSDTYNDGRWPVRAVELLRPYRRINL